MSAKIAEGKTLKREIKVYGVERGVIITLSQAGVEFRVKGAKMGVGNSWAQLIDKGCLTPSNVPCWLEGKPLELLTRQAKTITDNAVKRLDKKKKENA